MSSSDDDRGFGPVESSAAALGRDHAQIERRWPREIGDDYACTVIHEGHLTILVVSEAAAAAAEAMRPSLESGASLEVALTEEQFRRTTMDRALEEIDRARPAVPFVGAA